MLYNFLFRVTGARRTAKQLLAAVAQAAPGGERESLLLARDLSGVLISLTQADLSGFSYHPDPLSEEQEDRDLVALEQALKARLTPFQLLVVELLLVDGRPAGEVAELFGTTSGAVHEFITRLLIDSMDTPCEHLRGLVEQSSTPHADCQSCRSGLERLRALSRDSRIFSLTDFDHLRSALAAPKVDLTRRPRTPPPPKPRKPARERHASPLPAPKLPAVPVPLACALCLFAMTALTPKGSEEATAIVQTHARTAIAAGQPGTYGERGGPQRALPEVAALGSSAHAPLVAHLPDGTRLELAPRSRLRLDHRALELTQGQLSVAFKARARTDLVIRAGDLAVQVDEGELEIAQRARSVFQMRVIAGTAVATDGAGQSYTLKAGQQLSSNPGQLASSRRR